MNIMENEIKGPSPEEMARFSANLHSALSQNKLNEALGIIAEIQSKQYLEEISSYFIIHYKYNFKSRFFEKADFQDCLKLSDVLNHRGLQELS